jgi:PAS domain S-box-containing protein
VVSDLNNSSSLEEKKSTAWTGRNGVWAIALGLVGLAINLLPFEILPGLHLIFGSVFAILAAVKYGAAAGSLAGLIAGLPTGSVRVEPFLLSALLGAGEGAWVGRRTRSGKREPFAAVLSYWLLIGAWLGLAGQLFIMRIPLREALILQARSVINAILAGMLVELGLLVYEVIWRRQGQPGPERFTLRSLATLILTSLLTFPLLYISTHDANSERERMMSDMAVSSAVDVRSVEIEVRTLLESHSRGLKTAASLFSSPPHKTDDAESLGRLLSSMRYQYPLLRRLSLTDVRGRTLATDPPQSASLDTAIDQNGIPFYEELPATKTTVYSTVIQDEQGLAVVAGEPIFDRNNLLTGFVLGWMDLEGFQKALPQYDREGAAVIITDREGRIIADSADPNRQSEVRLADHRDFELVRQQGGGTNYYEQTGVSAARRLHIADGFHLSTAMVPPTGWWVWSKQTVAPLATRLEGLYLNNLMVLLGALFLSFLLSRALIRLLTNPVAELQQSAAALAAGDFRARPRGRFITTELDSLLQSFRLMAESLESSWGRQQELLGEVSVAKGELEATFDAMTDAVVLTDAEDRIVRANRSYYRLRGVEPEQAVGRTLADIAHAKGDWRACEVCCARREGRHAVVLKKPEENLIRRDLEIRVDPIYSGSGERLGAVQILRDLTERRQAEAEAEKASALLKNLVDAAYDGIYAADLAGHFLWANKQAADLFGLDSQGIEGRSYLHAAHPDDLSRVRAAFDAAASGEARSYEARYLSADRGARYVLVTNSPVYTGGEVAAVLGVMRDVTGERAAREVAMRNDKLRALGQLASGVAHNFNNSLTAVLGYTQMVIGKLSDQKLVRHLHTVEMAALDAAKMVQRIQNFARRSREEPSGVCELSGLIGDALDLTRSRWRDDARAAGINYEVEFRPAGDMVVVCDQSALREVFVNLIINALDAMAAGGRLVITTEMENGSVLINFTDTGCGITEEVRQRLFEPFYTTKGAKGYGMGLAVTFGIIERHGGEIAVSSEPGHGSTFKLKLPVALGVEEIQVEAGTDRRARQATVLVVDDEAPIRVLIGDLLRARGHKVEAAEDGLAGIRAVQKKRYDLVITDLSMPGADGWTVIRETRRLWPDAKVMLVTGYGNLKDRAFPGGDMTLVDDFISKPFDIAEIDSKVNELLLSSDDASAS